MKVLWLCNRGLSDSDTGGTGTWLDALARALADVPGIELGVVAPGRARGVVRHDYGRVAQWLVCSAERPRRDGLPAAGIVAGIQAAARTFAPDLLHPWGTENYWGLLTARGLLPGPALLEMQGIKYTIADVFAGGLSVRERLGCIGVKEVLKRRTLMADCRAFARWGRFEREMMAGHRFVSCPSPWIAAHVRAAHAGVRLFQSDPMLRPVFTGGEPWREGDRAPVVFCSMAYPSPFKGVHVAIRALALLRQRVPDARLRIAGLLQRPGVRQEGYMRWINRLVQRLGLTSAVEWLGPLTGLQLAEEMRTAAAGVVPTFVESYGLSLAEPMALGLPTVSAFVGGTSYLGRDEDTCLFFPAGDAAMCAYQLERLLTDRALAARVSERARAVTRARNDAAAQVRRQLGVYRQVLSGGAATTIG